MSYNEQSFSDYGIYASAPALYDVAAIQYLYGANTGVRSGNDTYNFSNTTSPFTKVIWDGGGSDTIDASGQTLGAKIDLNPGQFSSIGVSSTYYYTPTAAYNNVSIAYGANIENAIGGSGADTLIGNNLSNSLSGGSGGDTIKGADGNDMLNGDAGSDQLWGGNGNDTIYGGADGDYIYAESGNDILDGGTGGDYLYGGIGNDNLSGGDGADYLHGENDADILYGGDGGDYLYGEDGNDILDGGTGSDYLYGGAGIDTAVWHLPKASYKLINLASGGSITVYDGATYDYMPDNTIEYYKFTDGIFAASNSGTAAQVYRLYGAALGRTPDNSGLKNWISTIEAGALTLKQAASGFTSSTEFLNRYGNPDNKTFVTLLYNNVLGRTPDAAGLTNWVNALSSGMSRADAVLGFSESVEDMEKSRATVEKGLWLSDDQAAQIARLYHATLNRLPDAGGLESWTAALKSGMTLLQASDGFTKSTEFQQKYGSLNDTAFVTLLYNNVLGRSPDSAGLANWTSSLRAGNTRANVVMGFSESDEHISKRASYIDDGIKLYGSSPLGAQGMASNDAGADGASSSFVDQVAQLGLLEQSTLSASSGLTAAPLTNPYGRSGILAGAA
jgi:serralysin